MKKLLFIPALAIVFSMGITSCSKCQLCKKNNSPEVKVCEKDYNTNTEYGVAVDGYKAQGYTCNNSL